MHIVWNAENFVSYYSRKRSGSGYDWSDDIQISDRYWGWGLKLAADARGPFAGWTNDGIFGTRINATYPR